MKLHNPRLAGAGLDDADEAAARLVLLAETVPMELDFDATVYIGVDFVARRPDHDRRLGTEDARAGRPLRRAVLVRGGHQFEFDGQILVLAIRRSIRRRRVAVGGADDQIVGLYLLVRKFDLKVAPDGGREQRPLGEAACHLAAIGVEPDFAVALARRRAGGGELRRPVVDLADRRPIDRSAGAGSRLRPAPRRRADRLGRGFLFLEVGGGGEEIIVMGDDIRRADAAAFDDGP